MKPYPCFYPSSVWLFLGRKTESGEAEAIACGRNFNRAATGELAGDEHGCQMVHKFLLEEALDWPGSEIRVEAL